MAARSSLLCSLLLGLSAICSALWGAPSSSLQLEPQLKEGGWNASVVVDVGRRNSIPPTLFGIFFEEIGHAGDGGLYAEMVQDRSFDAIAAASGFSQFLLLEPSSQNQQQQIDLNSLAATHRIATDATIPPNNTPSNFTSKEQASAKHGENNSIIISWLPLPSTVTALTRDDPLNPSNQVAMEVTVGGNGGGIFNLGYWGIHVQQGHKYTYSFYARNPSSSADVELTLAVASAKDMSHTHAKAAHTVPCGNAWKKYQGELQSSGSDGSAVLALTFDGPATLAFDAVSLFPSENVAKGQELGLSEPWPFRKDLLQALKDLRPGFLRFPGGCFVEGDLMKNAFLWKDSVGKAEERPGHMNGVWGYWSTDGLGLLEYMLLSEELETEPIWVINNGIAHADSIPTSDVWPLVQDALDSVEFISGPANSTWGALRASMGHPEPWKLNFMAIGNEDCGKPYYTENYDLFFGALRARYPHLRLISNCEMGQGGPTDLWDWHIYTNPRALFDKRREFDNRDPNQGRFIFASEYAVTDGGGWGNVIGAIAEAGFMTGLERNARAVPLAAYAPLFVHWNDRPWPTNLIVFNNHQWFGIPSYHVQRMFRQTQGTSYVETSVTEIHADPSQQQDTVAASCTCQDADCNELVVKLVNFSPRQQSIAVSLVDSLSPHRISVSSTGEMVVLTGPKPEDENSFDDPMKIAPFGVAIDGVSDSFVLDVPAWSLSMLQLHLEAAPFVA